VGENIVTVMPIRTLGDPVLRETAAPVDVFDDALRRLVDDMLETMYAAPGVGLAGNQVGLRTACFVYDDREGHAGFVANPRLSEPEGEETLEEGCLSIPGPYHPTIRAARVRLVGADLGGEPLDVVAEGLLARIFQHETDHLVGKLYIDRLDEAGRREVLAELRRIELGLQEPGRRHRPQ
jgi:peptide deformylase